MKETVIETYDEPADTIMDLEYQVKDDEYFSGSYSHIRYSIDIVYTPNGIGVVPVSVKEYMEGRIRALDEKEFPGRTTKFLDDVYKALEGALESPDMLSIRLEPSLHHVDDERQHGLYHVNALIRGDENEETLFEGDVDG
ncbi:MAG: hypothetical protein SVU32_04405 [Candidatus Nanohaloarchaea archaeon]|nr:hypothetical protein [Candidatus Nanohaloarchaea archaeon]